MTENSLKSPGTETVDQAFVRKEVYGTVHENTFSGALSFMRRLYSKDLSGCDFAVTGVTLDSATTHRPGARFGPQAIRSASVNLAWGAPWPWGFDPFDRLAVIDYGDCDFDHGRPESIPGSIEAHIDRILNAGARSIVLGGDHFITLPIVRAHAKKHGKISLIHFDSHSDTWKADNEAGRVDHGTMFYHAVLTLWRTRTGADTPSVPRARNTGRSEPRFELQPERLKGPGGGTAAGIHFEGGALGAHPFHDTGVRDRTVEELSHTHRPVLGDQPMNVFSSVDHGKERQEREIPVTSLRDECNQLV